MSEYRNLLVPFDFSDHSRAALSTATDLARRLGADVVHVIHVIQPPIYGYGAPYGAAAPLPIDMIELRESAMRALQEAVTAIEGAAAKLELHVVEGSNIVTMIQEVAEEVGADLIVMGTHGRTGLAHVFLGSVAERTLRVAPCPVLSVRAPASTA